MVLLFTNVDPLQELFFLFCMHSTVYEFFNIVTRSNYARYHPDLSVFNLIIFIWCSLNLTHYQLFTKLFSGHYDHSFRVWSDADVKCNMAQHCLWHKHFCYAWDITNDVLNEPVSLFTLFRMLYMYFVLLTCVLFYYIRFCFTMPIFNDERAWPRSTKTVLM